MDRIERPALQQHPSYLELDRYALGVACEPGTASHVASCARCQAHLSDVAPAQCVPHWVVQLAAVPPRRRVPRRAWLASAGLTAAAAVAAVALWVLRPGVPERPYVGVKGLPAIALYVKHDQHVTLWRGEALAGGDRIRIEVAPEHYEHVSVFLENAQAPELLFAGPVRPHARTLLPKAWRLDASATAEEIAVVFSDRVLPAPQALRCLRTDDSAGARVVRLRLTKRFP